jgi:hypothetical protein
LTMWWRFNSGLKQITGTRSSTQFRYEFPKNIKREISQEMINIPAEWWFNRIHSEYQQKSQSRQITPERFKEIGLTKRISNLCIWIVAFVNHGHQALKCVYGKLARRSREFRSPFRSGSATSSWMLISILRPGNLNWICCLASVR